MKDVSSDWAQFKVLWPSYVLSGTFSMWKTNYADTVSKWPQKYLCTAVSYYISTDINTVISVIRSSCRCIGQDLTAVYSRRQYKSFSEPLKSKTSFRDSFSLTGIKFCRNWRMFAVLWGNILHQQNLRNIQFCIKYQLPTTDIRCPETVVISGISGQAFSSLRTETHFSLTSAGKQSGPESLFKKTPTTCEIRSTGLLQNTPSQS